MKLLKAFAGPSAEILSYLSKDMRSLDRKKCKDSLETCAKLFLDLETAHQFLIEKSALSKKDKKAKLKNLGAVKNNS
eukprot:7405999-Pyramimonas_sp.AAC.1